MYFDWKTWGIWLVGFIIMLIWVWIPVREFKRLVKMKKEERENISKRERHADN